jgi:hypothetical protein
MKVTINRLQLKVENLVSDYQSVKTDKKLFSEKIEVLSQKLEDQRIFIESLEEKNKILKLSSSINNETDSDKSSKKKINDLVREIDKCIALLNK